MQQAVANRDQSGAAVNSGQAAIEAAQANVDVLKAQQREAERTLDELKTAQAKAERDLSFTQIRAPIDGVIGNRAVKVGDFLQTGTRLASLVPLDDVYIDANFKETQLAHLRPGQPVAVSVDALPRPPRTPPVVVLPGLTMSRFEPSLLIESRTWAWAPWPSPTVRITAAMPMRMPSMVSAERRRWDRTASIAVRNVSKVFTRWPPTASR